jgi:hypothetical protein
MADIDNFEIVDPTLKEAGATVTWTGPSPTGQTAQPATNINTDLKVGYIIALKQDNSLLFDVLGTNPGLMELLGLHKHANDRIEKIYSEKQQTGDFLTLELAKMIHTLSGTVVELTSKVDRLLAEKNIPSNSL